VVLGDEGVLLVQNRRRNGSHDWTPPGGVIEVHEGESLVDGLTREVEEETGLRVSEWVGPIWSVITEAAGLGWRLTVEVHLAVAWEGALRVDDPDGIVVDARFVAPGECSPLLEAGHPWVREPLAEWLEHRWEEARPFGYRVDGNDMRTITVTRLD
jgi:8-oxo-dGTP diphosphatase